MLECMQNSCRDSKKLLLELSSSSCRRNSMNVFCICTRSFVVLIRHNLNCFQTLISIRKRFYVMPLSLTIFKNRSIEWNRIFWMFTSILITNASSLTVLIIESFMAVTRKESIKLVYCSSIPMLITMLSEFRAKISLLYATHILKILYVWIICYR